MRLIDADVVYKLIELCEIKKDTYGSLLNDWDHGYNAGLERAESEIECALTVDAVEVIRCKDCKHRSKYMSDSCDSVIGYWEDNDFCSRAERKEE